MKKIELNKRQAKFIISMCSKVSLRELATICAEKYPELKICPGNQIDGIELFALAKEVIKKK